MAIPRYVAAAAAKWLHQYEKYKYTVKFYSYSNGLNKNLYRKAMILIYSHFQYNYTSWCCCSCSSIMKICSALIKSALWMRKTHEVLLKTRPRRPTMRPYSVIRMFEFLVVAVIEEMVRDSFNPHFTVSITLRSFLSVCMTLSELFLFLLL